MGGHLRSDRGRSPAAPGRMHGLHRHGPGPRERQQQPAHHAPQLSRPFRHQGGLGLPVLTGDRRGCRADRHGSPTRGTCRSCSDIDYPEIELPEPVEREHRNARASPCRRRRPAQVELVKGAEHLLAPGLRSAARPHRGAGRAQGGRRRLHRRDSAGRCPGAALPQQHPQARRIHLRPARRHLRRPRRTDPRRAPGTSWSAARTTARAPPGNTPRSPRATSGCAPWWPSRSRGSTGRTWPTSASWHSSSPNAADHDRIEQGDVLAADRNTRRPAHRQGDPRAERTRGEVYPVRHSLSSRQVDMLLAGGLIPWLRERRARE